MSFLKAFAFALVVTLASQTIDIIIHFLGGIAVHLPYLAVKTTVIFWALLWFTYWKGIAWGKGFWATGLASTLFYAYYRFAEPTLDRTLFVLDEATLFIFIHWVAIYVPYWLTWKFILPGNVAAATLKDDTALSVAIVTAVVGIAGMMPSRQFLKAYNLSLGLTYNDHVLIGTLALVLTVAALWKYLARTEELKT